MLRLTREDKFGNETTVYLRAACVVSVFSVGDAQETVVNMTHGPAVWVNETVEQIANMIDEVS